MKDMGVGTYLQSQHSRTLICLTINEWKWHRKGTTCCAGIVVTALLHYILPYY